MNEGTCVDFPLEKVLRNSLNALVYGLPAGLATEHQDLRQLQCLNNLGSISSDWQLVAFLLKEQSPTVGTGGAASTHQHLLVRRTSSTSFEACLDLFLTKLMRGVNVPRWFLILSSTGSLRGLHGQLYNT